MYSKNLIYLCAQLYRSERKYDRSIKNNIWQLLKRASNFLLFISISILPNSSDAQCNVNIKLNGTLVGGGDAFSYEVSGTTVVYQADQDADNVIELYSVPVGGGTPVKLNGPLVAGGGVQPGFVVSGTTVVYRADQDADNVLELYSVPVCPR